MQGFWILLLGVQIMYSCAAISPTKTYYEELGYGDQLSIRLSREAENLHFTSVDETEQVVLWAKWHATKKGIVTGMNDDRNFVIRSVTFDDQGTYTVLNALNRKTSIYLLKVITKRISWNCAVGQTFKIPLAGLARHDATLHFSNQDLNLTLVDHGSPVVNSHPEYMGRIQVTPNSIELHSINVSDVGNYTLRDGLNRRVVVYAMYLGDYHQGITAGPLTALLMLLCIPPCICCCCRKKICKKSSQPNNTAAIRFDKQVNPSGPPPTYESLLASSGPVPGFSPSVFNSPAAPASSELVKGKLPQTSPLLTPEEATNPAL